MTYKNRLICLLSLTAFLALAYALSFVFNSGIGGAGSSSYVWLDSKNASRINRIVISSQGEEIELLKQNNQWFVSHNGVKYPARQMRTEDFLSILTTRSVWPVRSSSASTHERFGLDEQASRVTIYAGNTGLLDLLLGADDVSGREAYFCKYGQNEVRSGDNSIKTYITGPAVGWYNFRLIPESEGGNIDVDSVQRLSVYNEGRELSFSRKNRGWAISGIDIENPDQAAIENYIRIVLNTEGDNFADSVFSGDPAFNNSRITLEFGNGRVLTIRLSEPDETGRRLAHAGGSELIYSIPPWAAGRLFIDAANLELR